MLRICGREFFLNRQAFEKTQSAVKVFLKKKLFPLGFRKSESFLAEIDGLIHVGANVVQDRGHYAQYSLNVVWIEPVPEIFSILQRNLLGFHSQRAIQACF
jgi:hypothetical protein